MFRSKYAAPEVPTFVELTFQCCGACYTIRRNPEYQCPSKRKAGLKTQKADAVLYCPNERIISKVREVNQAITEIVGTVSYTHLDVYKRQDIDCGKNNIINEH